MIASVSLNKKSEQAIAISRSVAEQVMREGVGLLCVDTRVLCAPLIAGERTLGLIYLDTNNPAIVLDEDHLQLLTAVCACCRSDSLNASAARARLKST